MATLYLTEQYATVRRSGETLEVHPAEARKGAEGGAVVKIPLHKIDRVVVQGEVTLTGSVIRLLLEKRIPVAFCSYYGGYEGMLTPIEHKHGELRQAQYRAAQQKERAIPVAAAIVRAKVFNQKVWLQRAARDRENSALRQAVGQLEAILTTLAGTALPDNLATARSWLMGQEGSAARAYFRAFPALLESPMGFTKRVRRPPTDPINAMLSYGYSLLSYATASAVQIVGMDLYTGFLHSTHYGRPALAIDLMEAFRVPIVDSVVRRVVNTGAVTADDFVPRAGGVGLSDKGRRAFLSAYEQRMQSTVTHPVFGMESTYQRCLELEARQVARLVMGESDTFVPFTFR